jgi:hypothetical protein
MKHDLAGIACDWFDVEYNLECWQSWNKFKKAFILHFAPCGIAISLTNMIYHKQKEHELLVYLT